MADIYSKGKKSVDGISGGLRFEQDNNRIIGRDENNIPNLVIQSDDNGFNMKISKPTKDVLSVGDVDLIFNSQHNLFKIIQTGSIVMPTYSVTSTTGWRSSSVAFPPNAVVAHNLGVVPVVLAFLRVTGPGGPTSLVLPYTDFGIIGTAAYFHTISMAVDATYLQFGESTITNGSVGTLTHGGGTIDYYILQETVA